MAQKQELSQTAFDRLKAEYDDLTTRGRIEIALAIEPARELGDLSENGDYHAAKEQQGLMEGRIRQLHSIIENAVVVYAPTGVVGVGSIVTIVYQGDDDDMAERYLVGHMEERTRELMVISPNSPMGKKLIGRTIGDAVKYEGPSGPLMVRILRVERT